MNALKNKLLPCCLFKKIDQEMRNWVQIRERGTELNICDVKNLQ